MRKYTSYPHQTKTDGIDVFDGLKIDDNEKIEEPNNLNINVLEIFKDKTLTQFYVSKIMSKFIIDENRWQKERDSSSHHEDYQWDVFEDNQKS